MSIEVSFWLDARGKGVLEMEELFKIYLSEEEKDELIEKLTPELLLLRTKAEMSQEEIANIIGTSRQTYGAIERKTRKMSWNTYLSLVWFYDYNRKTHKMVRNMKAFPHEFIKKINDGDEPQDFELGLLFKADNKNILESLDEQALSTIRTVLMVEYSRCNNISGEKVVRMFEGLTLKKEAMEEEKNTAKAIKNIKRKNLKDE